MAVLVSTTATPTNEETARKLCSDLIALYQELKLKPVNSVQQTDRRTVGLKDTVPKVIAIFLLRESAYDDATSEVSSAQCAGNSTGEAAIGAQLYPHTIPSAFGPCYLESARALCGDPPTGNLRHLAGSILLARSSDPQQDKNPCWTVLPC